MKNSGIAGASIAVRTLSVFWLILMLLFPIAHAEEGSEGHAETGSQVSAVDGHIHPDEYEFEAVFFDGNYKLYGRLEGDFVFFGISAEDIGWIGLGLDPEVKMKDADIIVGWVADDSETTVLDSWSVGEKGPHPPDEQLGGTHDIIEYAGREDFFTTVIEFKRKRDTGDQWDKAVSGSEPLSIIWALGLNDDPESDHSAMGKGTINFRTGETTGKTSILLWPYHAFLMSSSLLAMVAGFIIIRYAGKKKWRLKAHKTAGILANIFSLTGLIIAFYMVIISETGHFRKLHSILGAVAVLGALSALTTGYAQFAKHPFKKLTRRIHPQLGRFLILLTAFTAVLGFRLIL